MIEIEEAKCNGCGACAKACHEGAIVMMDGKARLLRDDYCDGLGDCLPACPMDAIHFIEREAPAYDEVAVRAAQSAKTRETVGQNHAVNLQDPGIPAITRLSTWPVQLRLAPQRAAWFDGASLLIAADCTAYAYARFHEDMMRGKVTLIGRPKLDAANYAEKLTAILALNRIRSLCVVRMEVPCCQGLEAAAKQALKASGRQIPLQTLILSTDGRIKE